MFEDLRRLFMDWQRWIFPVALVLVATVAAWPLLSEPGLLNTRGGGDSPFLLQRVQQLVSAVADGHFPVRWMPDANYGYGYPFYNYYAPLSIYIAGAFKAFGLTYVRAIHAAQLAGFLMAAWGIYLLAVRWQGSKWAGLISAVAYTVAPFHMVNVYVRGDSLAEFWAMALYPWVILAADGTLSRDLSRHARAGRLALLALAYAALILSHNISALIFSPFLLLYILLAWYFGRRRNPETGLPEPEPERRPALWRLWLPLAGILLAFGLSAWFFVPALAEQSLAQLGPVTEGYFHYSNHFRDLDLVQRTLIFDYSVSGGNAFKMGLVQFVLALIGGVLLIIQRRKTITASVLFTLATFVVATLMITSLTQLLWEYLPLLSFTQFPWRFLSVQAFAAALMTGALAWLPFRQISSVLVIGLLFVAGMGGLRTDHLILTDADVTPERLAQYEWFTGNIGTTVSAEYLPETVNPRPYSSAWLTAGNRNMVRALDGELFNVTLVERRATSQEWLIDSGGATLLFPTLAWPGWTATIDDTSAEILPADGSGLITLTVPPGAHRITLELARTPLRFSAEMISLLTLAFVGLLWGISVEWTPRRTIGSLAAIGLLIGAALITRAALRPSFAQHDLNWDFAQMAYLSHSLDGVVYDNGVVVDHYTYSQDSVVANEPWTITLNVANADGSEATLALTRPATAWPSFEPEPPVILSQTRTLDGEQTQFDFILPSTLPTGLLIPRLTLAEGEPLTPSGQTRGDLYLRPLNVLSSTSAETATNGLDVAALDASAEGDGLSVRLAYTTPAPLSQNLKLSLRLIAPDGTWLSQTDAQPGYGFSPSLAWQPGSVTFDRMALPLPEGRWDESLMLVAQLYDAASGEPVLIRWLGDVAWSTSGLAFTPRQPDFSPPADLTPLTARFEEQIALRGYTLDTRDGAVVLTLGWEALTPPAEDVVRFVHLVDTETGEILAQVDGHPRRNSYPFSQWSEGEFVTETVWLTPSAEMPDSVALAIGLYSTATPELARLSAVDADGSPLPNDQLILDELALP